MKGREFYKLRAKDLIKELRESRQMSYADLALKLKAYGQVMSERALISRINRGSLDFAFAMMVMDALSVDVLELPKQEAMYPVGHRPGQALTKADMKRRNPNSQGN